MLKNQATQTMAFCATRPCRSSAAPASCAGQGRAHLPRGQGNAIGGGAEEIMKDLASRQLGL